MKSIRRYIRHLYLRFSFVRLLTFGHYSDVPERNIILGYALYILIGFGLLMLPVSCAVPCWWIDNLFTAASALSTTGLASVDIPGVYTVFGQCVILLLVQLGAVGYMTLSTYIMYRLTHHATGYANKVMGASLGIPSGIRLRDLVNSVVHFTLVFEILGFVSFLVTFISLDVPSAAWNAFFLSISSFCTAGFSPFSDSLCMFCDNIAVNLTVAVLSYAGAMGFIVITDITRKLRDRRYHITFTSKVIFLVTGIMTVGGTVALFLSPGMAAGGSAAHRLLLSFFQTMSAMTTVGFNTVDLSFLRAGPILVFSLIMFIGASPSGTGGGVKSTSVTAVWGFVKSKLGLSREVTFMGRIIPSYRVDSALTSVLVYGAVIFVGCVILAYTEPFKLSQILFEATSAIGTVGLSTGITPELTSAGKLVLITLMYIGRAGVITVGSALVVRRSRVPSGTSDLVA